MLLLYVLQFLFRQQVSVTDMRFMFATATEFN